MPGGRTRALRGGASHEAKGLRGVRGGGAGRVGPPATRRRLCLLRQIGDKLVASLEQFLLVDDVVAVEDGAALVAGQEHGDSLGHAGADQVAGGGAAAIVEEAGRHAGRLTGGAPGRAPAADGDAVAVEDERAGGVTACPPSREGLGNGLRDRENPPPYGATKRPRLVARIAEAGREFVPALFIKMFGDPVENPNGWHSKKLGSFGTLDRGRSRHRPRNAPELYGGPYPFVQTGDIANSRGLVTQYSQTYSEIGLDQSKLWPSGTLCITIAANIGMTGILTFDSCFPDSIVGFQPSSIVTVEYVQTTVDLVQHQLEQNEPRAAQQNINLNVLGELTIPTPPLHLQRRYAEIVEASRAAFCTSESGTKTAAALTASLMFRLLGNDISVRETCCA